MNNPYNDSVSEEVTETYYETYWLWGTQGSGHPIADPEDPFSNLIKVFHEKYKARRYVNFKITSQNGVFSFLSILVPTPVNGFWNVRTVIIEAGIVNYPKPSISAEKK